MSKELDMEFLRADRQFDERTQPSGEYARGVQDGYALALKHIRNQVDRLEEAHVG